MRQIFRKRGGGLTSLYIERDMEAVFAHQVVEQLMVKYVLDAHAREELRLTGPNSVQPLQAAFLLEWCRL